MKTPIDGPTNAVPALMSLPESGSAIAVRTNSAARPAPPTTVAEQPALKDVDETSALNLPPWALDLGQGAEQSSDYGIDGSGNFVEEHPLTAGGGAEAEPPQRTFIPTIQSRSADASVTPPLRTSPPWEIAMSR